LDEVIEGFTAMTWFARNSGPSQARNALVLASLCSSFCRAGIAVLLYDHRNFWSE
jgi:hypothetical protein